MAEREEFLIKKMPREQYLAQQTCTLQLSEFNALQKARGAGAPASIEIYDARWNLLHKIDSSSFGKLTFEYKRVDKTPFMVCYYGDAV